MKSLALVLTLLFIQQIPKNNPNGIWEATGRSQYEIRANGSNLLVKIVPGSNPKFLQYELTMKNEEEANTYSGTGFFIAKMEGGKECKVPTEWRFVVVTPERIIGMASNMTVDQKTCEVKEKTQVQLDLKKKK